MRRKRLETDTAAVSVSCVAKHEELYIVLCDVIGGYIT